MTEVTTETVTEVITEEVTEFVTEGLNALEDANSSSVERMMVSDIKMQRVGVTSHFEMTSC